MGLHTNKIVGGSTAGVNAISNVASGFGPWGIALAAALKIGNMAGGKNLSTLNVKKRVDSSTGYSGTKSRLKQLHDDYSGGMVGGFDNLFGVDERIEKKLSAGREEQNNLMGVLNTAD
jgi:hypothetical protein